MRRTRPTRRPPPNSSPCYEEHFERAFSLGPDVNTTTTVEEGEFDTMSAGDVSAPMLAIKVGCTRAWRSASSSVERTYGLARITV